jgi:hypothetical protein
MCSFTLFFHAMVAPLLLFASSSAPYLVCARTFRSDSRRRGKLRGRTPRLSSRLLIDLSLSLLGVLLQMMSLVSQRLRSSSRSDTIESLSSSFNISNKGLSGRSRHRSSQTPCHYRLECLLKFSLALVLERSFGSALWDDFWG